jgi:micrococcal nuclease
MLKILLFVAALMASFIPYQTLRAEEPSPEKGETSAPAIIPPPKFENLKEIPVPVFVQKVTGPLSFLGKDGNLYSLTGIDVPDSADQTSELPKTALMRLTKLIEGKEIKTFVTQKDDRGRINRLGERLIHAVEPKGKIWIEGQLLSEGLARVRTTPDTPEMAKPLLAIEEKARNAGIGLWRLEEFQLLTPKAAVGKENAFHLVEGTVESVASLRNVTFVNFGPDWKTDFTIGLTPAMRKQLARRNFDPMKLQGKTVRVRGWVRSYNGPYIEPTHPEQIEIVEKNVSADGAPQSSEADIEKPIPPTAPVAPTRMRTIGETYKNPEVQKPDDDKSPDPTPESGE